ncbi:MAG TPA: helix-turn-helix domain-containing protein [Stellaceae bacterium]|nr:helix-turn-helix domain-containing protein [Stellaceae bacterium]
MSPRFPPSTARSVDILAFPSVQLLDVAGPLQVFATANQLAERAGASLPYKARMIARGDGRVVASAGLGLAGDPLPPASEAADTLIVAGGPGVHEFAADEAAVAWLLERSRHVRRLASVCTGAFLLAAAGLLDGRRVVTHWDWCDRLAERFPALAVERDPIFVEDAGVWTSAGVTAGIDLALAFLNADLGRDAALAVARELVVFLKRPGGQAQYSAALALQNAAGPFDALHQWIAEYPASDLSTGAMAARVGMSERSFLRRYRAATGSTPGRAVERLRVEAACRLLSDTAQPIKQVARLCGFGAAETMRRSFQRVLAISPQAYRERFPGTADATPGPLLRLARTDRRASGTP